MAEKRYSLVSTDRLMLFILTLRQH